MWNAECGIERRASIPHSEFRIPRSAVEHRRLVGGRARRREPEVAVRGYRGDAGARRAREETLLHQGRLRHILPRAPRPPPPRAQPPYAHTTAPATSSIRVST